MLETPILCPLKVSPRSPPFCCTFSSYATDGQSKVNVPCSRIVARSGLVKGLVVSSVFDSHTDDVTITSDWPTSQALYFGNCIPDKFQIYLLILKIIVSARSP